MTSPLLALADDLRTAIGRLKPVACEVPITIAELEEIERRIREEAAKGVGR